MQVIVWFILLALAEPAAAQEKDWDQWVAAAKKEGKLVVSGPPEPRVRIEIPQKFTARFGIPVEYIGGRSAVTAARLRTERPAGLYTLDAFLSGIQTMANILYPEKMLDPLRPALILPEVADPAKWKKGKLWFADPEDRYVLRLFNHVSPMIHINTRYVSLQELQQAQDLLSPKWTGKIAAYDPTIQGSGSGDAAQLYHQLGEEFVKKLYVDQKPVLSQDRRQLADWLGRGVYPIALSLGGDDIEKLKSDGFPVATLFNLADLPSAVTAGFGLVAIVNKAPHPNAARVFANWIASKEGLQTYSRAEVYAATRNDLDESFLRPEEIPRPGVNYFDVYDWQFALTGREKSLQRIRELLQKK